MIFPPLLLPAAFLLVCPGSLLASPTADLSETSGPLELWEHFDPDEGDFNEEIVKEVTAGGIHTRDSYISAYLLGEEIRVYCRYAVKTGARNAPGLLNVHGWMGAPAIDRNYVKDGWAVMAHDYCGETSDRAHFTKYPETLLRGNMDKRIGYRVKSKLPDGSFITNPEQTDDYLWYAIQRRVLSYLLSQKEVDPDRLGAKGYSYGGTLMWNLGTDPRIRAFVAYFGVGWLEYYRSRGVWMFDGQADKPEENPGETLYLSTIAPQSHAPHITAAALWLNGTNDHHGGHERGEQTFRAFRSNIPWSFAHQPRGHHDTRDIGQNARLWLEKHVLGKDIDWPGEAGSKIVLDAQGVPELHVSPADPDRVNHLEIYYALKNPVSYGRAWRNATLRRKGDVWIGKMPVLNVRDYVFGFSNIQYDNTVVRSSPFTATIPESLGDAIATDRRSLKLNNNAAWFNSGPVEGKNGISGFRALSPRGTFNEQFSDPKWQAPEGAQLHFKFYCTQPQAVEIAINNHYLADIRITASDDWQEMTLEAGQFIHRFSKNPLADWSQTKKVAIKPLSGADIAKIIFAGFQWVSDGRTNPPN